MDTFLSLYFALMKIGGFALMTSSVGAAGLAVWHARDCTTATKNGDMEQCNYHERLGKAWLALSFNCLWSGLTFVLVSIFGKWVFLQ